MLKNKMFLYTAATVAIISLFFLLKKKKTKALKKDKQMRDPTTGDRQNFSEQDAKDALLKVKQKYGAATAQLAEQILRWETNHFRSAQYKATGSAGMEKGKWAGLPADMPTADFRDNHTKEIRPFVIWESVFDFLEYLIAYAKRWGGNWARWNTTDAMKQQEYKRKVLSVTPRFIV